MRVLVVSASRHGATNEIAEALAAELVARGFETDVRKAENASGVDGYDAVVLGSAVYVGSWLDTARGFADEHAAELAATQTWLFSSGPVGDPPRPTEENAVHIADLLEKTGANGHRLFAGKLDRSKLGFGERAMVAAFRAPEGDFRDWDEIRSWAGGIADALRR